MHGRIEMKITKEQLKDIIREELTEATQSHQHFKFPDNRNAEDFAQEIANSALATGKVKGDTVAVNISKIRKARTHRAIADIMTKFKGKLDFKITFESLNEAKDFYLMDVGTTEVRAFYRMERGEHKFGPKLYGQRFSSKSQAERSKKELNQHREHRGRTLRVVTGGDNDPAESIVNEASGNINVSALTRTEIQMAIGVLNFFGTGSQPHATGKNLAHFKVDYLADLIKKNKNRLEATAKKHLDKMVKKLNEGVNEDIFTTAVYNKNDTVMNDIFFGLQKSISKNAKNNKLRAYSSEVAHSVADILIAVEEDRLSIGEVIRALNKLGGSADKRTPPADKK